MQNAPNLENNILSDYNNKINNYVSGNRENNNIKYSVLYSSEDGWNSQNVEIKNIAEWE